MFSKILAAIKSFFSSLFGGSGNSKNKLPTGPQVNVPQDGSEIKPDSIVVIANEMEEVVLLPNEPDVEFDEDIFDEEEEHEEEPVVEAPEEPVVTTPETEPTPPVTEVPDTPKGRYLWCLDNGHGQLTRGKRSPMLDDGTTQLLEYEFNRDVVQRIATQLTEKGISHFVVVPETDISDFLEERVKRANAKKSDLPKIFVSVHANAAPARSASDWAPDSICGIETWFYHGSRKGQKVASVFQKHLIAQTGFKNRHLKSRPNSQFYVLRKTKMTAILTENGFYNNKPECTELMKPEVRQKIADAHVAAIVEIEENGLEAV